MKLTKNWASTSSLFKISKYLCRVASLGVSQTKPRKHKDRIYKLGRMKNFFFAKELRLSPITVLIIKQAKMTLISNLGLPAFLGLLSLDCLYLSCSLVQELSNTLV